MASRTPFFSLRRARWVLFVLLGLEVFYLLAANLFLQPWAGPQWIRKRPDKSLVEWQGAWSAVPGLVHMRGLHVRGRTPTGRWELELDTLRAWVVVPRLLWRRFSVVGAHGSGMNFRLAREPTDGETVGRPTIEGFAPHLDKPQTARRRFTIDFKGARLDRIEEIWIDHQRYVGQGHLTGSARFEMPERKVSLPRLELVLEDGILSVDGVETGELERLEANLEIEPYRLKEHRGLAGLRFVSGTLDLEAPRANLGVLGYLFRDVAWLDLGGEGALQADLHLQRGQVVPESWLHAWALVNTRYLDYRIDGAARVRGAVVEPGDDVPASSLEVTFDSFSVRQENQAAPHAFGEGAVLHATGPELDLAQPRLEWTAELRVPAARVPDLTYYNAYLPAESSVALLAGEGLVAAELRFDLSSAEVEGEVHVDGQGVDLLFHDVELRGDLSIDTEIQNGDALAKRFDISGTRMRIDNARLGTAASPGADNGWWGELVMRQGELDLNPLGLRSELDLHLRDTGPFVRLLNQGRQRPRWLNELLEIEDIKGHGSVVYHEASVDLGGVDLRFGDKLKFLGELKLSRESPHLLLYCKYGFLTVALEQIDQERAWGLVRSLRWYEARRTAWRSVP